jgi:hypothetical protein
MAKRLTRKLTDVIADVRLALASEFKITDEQIKAWRSRVDANGHQFPTGSTMVTIDSIWIDYEVQRDVIVKHIISIMKKYDPRLCGPVSACRILNSTTVDCMHIFAYDGQHRTIATAILGYDAIPCNIVETDDPSFPSYAFEELNESGVKRLSKGDLHRNALTRYKLGSREPRSILAFTMQEKFNLSGVDLQDKGQRRSAALCGGNDYFFSHFDYAEKVMKLDPKGNVLQDILTAIITVYPLQEEVHQSVFIGLYELARLDRNLPSLPQGWMVDVLKSVKKSFNNSYIVSDKAKTQWAYVNPGATWSAPSAMSNFLREVYIMNGGTINLPYHGEGAKMQVATNPAPRLFPVKEIANA